jgi:HEAT repeat protein
MERPDNLEEALERWRKGGASLDEVRALSRDIGKQQFAPGIPVLIELLDHEDEIVRYNATKALGFGLHHKPATDKMITMLGADADEDVRDVAAGALSTIWQNTREPRTLKALANAALTDPDEDLRNRAFQALLIVNGVSKEEHLDLLTSEKLEVDPTRVKAILAEISK